MRIMASRRHGAAILLIALSTLICANCHRDVQRVVNNPEPHTNVSSLMLDRVGETAVGGFLYPDVPPYPSTCWVGLVFPGVQHGTIKLHWSAVRLHVRISKEQDSNLFYATDIVGTNMILGDWCYPDECILIRLNPSCFLTKDKCKIEVKVVSPAPVTNRAQLWVFYTLEEAE